MPDITNFKNRWLAEGKVDFDRTYGYQCVDLIRQYFYDNYGLGDSAGGVGYAINYWTNTPAAVLGKFDKVEGSSAREGDVVVLRTAGRNDYTAPGHIVIATGAITDTKFEGLEQNGSTGNGSGIGPDAIRTRWIDRSRVAGILRPKGAAPAPQPAPAQPTGIAFTVELTAPKTVKLKKYPTMEWNLNHVDWPSFNNDPIGHNGDEVITVTAIATHRLGGRYYMQNPSVARGFNTVDVEDYTAPAPVVTPPAPKNYATDYTYERLASPMKLQTKIDANKWDLNFDDYPNVKSTAVLPKGTAFVAFGKASRNTLGREVYYMTEEDFGTAPITAHGINTVDLEPYVEPPAPAPVETPIVDPPVTEPSNPLPTEDGETIPVHVTPGDPNKWKESFTNVAAGDYKAIEDVTVRDHSDSLNPDKKLHKGQIVHSAGVFTKDFISYHRTKKSTAEGTWYGVPVTAVELEQLDEDGDIFNLDDIKLADELKAAVQGLSIRKRFIISWATIEGFFRGFFSKKKKK